MIKRIIHYSFILGFLIIVWLLWHLDFRETLHIFKTIQLDFLVGGLLFTVAELAFKAWKLQKVVNILTPISFFEAMKIYLIGLPYGAVTPGKVGDVVKLYTLRQKTNLPRTDCVALGLVERLLEMIALVGLAGVGVFVLLGHLSEKQFYSLLIAVVLLFVLMFLMLNQKLVRFLLRPIFYLVVPEDKQHKPRALFYEFYGGIEKMTKDKWTMSVGLFFCILGWLASSFRTYLFALGVGIFVMNWYQCLFLIPLVTVVELIPISLLGIGTRDLALISILTMMGASHDVVRPQAITLSFLMLVVGGIPPALVGYAVAIKEHVSWKDVDKEMKEENS